MGVAVGICVGVDVSVGVCEGVGDAVADGAIVGVGEEAGFAPPHAPTTIDVNRTINQ